MNARKARAKQLGGKAVLDISVGEVRGQIQRLAAVGEEGQEVEQGARTRRRSVTDVNLVMARAGLRETKYVSEEEEEGGTGFATKRDSLDAGVHAMDNVAVTSALDSSGLARKLRRLEQERVELQGIIVSPIKYQLAREKPALRKTSESYRDVLNEIAAHAISGLKHVNIPVNNDTLADGILEHTDDYLLLRDQLGPYDEIQQVKLTKQNFNSRWSPRVSTCHTPSSLTSESSNNSSRMSSVDLADFSLDVRRRSVPDDATMSDKDSLVSIDETPTNNIVHDCYTLFFCCRRLGDVSRFFSLKFHLLI